MEQENLSVAGSSSSAAAVRTPVAPLATRSATISNTSEKTAQQCHNKYADDRNVKSASAANTSKHKTSSASIPNSSDIVFPPIPPSQLSPRSTPSSKTPSSTGATTSSPVKSAEYGESGGGGFSSANHGSPSKHPVPRNMTSTSYPGRCGIAVSPTLKTKSANSGAQVPTSQHQPPLPDKKSESGGQGDGIYSGCGSGGPYDPLVISNTPDKDLDFNVYANVYAASFERKEKEKERPGEGRDQNLNSATSLTASAACASACAVAATATQCQLATEATSSTQGPVSSSHHGATPDCTTSAAETHPRHNSLPTTYPAHCSSSSGVPQQLSLKKDPSSSFSTPYQSSPLHPVPSGSTSPKQGPPTFQQQQSLHSSPACAPLLTSGDLESDLKSSKPGGASNPTLTVFAETSPTEQSHSFLGIKPNFKPRKQSPNIKRILKSPSANRVKQNKVALLEKSSSVDAATSASLYSQTGSSYDTCYSSFNGNDDLGEDISENPDNVTEIDTNCPNSPDPNKPKATFHLPTSASDHSQLNKLNDFNRVTECDLEDNDRYLNDHSNPTESLLTSHNSAGNLRQTRTPKSLASRNSSNNNFKRTGYGGYPHLDSNVNTLCYPNGSVNRGSPRNAQSPNQERGVNSRHSSMNSVHHPHSHSPAAGGGDKQTKRSSLRSNSGNVEIKLDSSVNRSGSQGGGGAGNVNRSASIGAGHLHSKESKQTQAHASYRLGFRRSLFEKRKKLSDYAMLFSLIGISLMVLEHELSYQLPVSTCSFH